MRGGIIPGLHDAEHAAAFFAGRARLLARGGPPRCNSLNRHGGKCGAWALKGHPFCVIHAPVPVRRERRLSLLRHPKTAKQLTSALIREQARLQRVAWKVDRWRDGRTVDLGTREDAFLADVVAVGFRPSTFSPASMDAARWRWLGLQSRQITVDQFRDRIRWNVALDAAGV